jgi:hypothetical protein
MKKTYFLFYFIFIHLSLLHSQTWNLPTRSATAMNGTQFVAAITSLGFTARENMIEQEILNGNVPSFYRNLKPVTSSATISGSPQTVTYYVTPDYLAVGTDTNYFLCPMSPIIATHIADATNCTLPTRKMVNDIYAAATVKLAPQPIPASGQMTTVPVFDDHNDSVYIQRHNSTWNSFALGELVGGDKKDVVISNSIYTTANRVVIYGWHTSVGNPIQPMSNVHGDTYLDYSHGIRLVQNAVVYNGSPTTVKAILQSSTLQTLLSDEGVIATPQYPYSTAITSLATPISFAIKNNGNNTLSILVSNDANTSHYKVYTSTDGTTFSAPQTIIKTALNLSGLTAGQIYFVKIAAYNQTNNITSSTSELLAAIPTAWQDSVLIVNGFDRASTGNTYNFCIQHGNAIKNAGYGFSSATNEAITNSLISLNTYKAVDWILGEESTVNETFSNTEQTRVSTYLKQGGKLFVSGAEIGWDIDQAGSVSDKQFYNDYLKASYLLDAPNNQSSFWYAAYPHAMGFLNSIDSIAFDNGTHGTYNVDYPDVIDTINGSIPILYYGSGATQFAGIAFDGMFPLGTVSGKLVHFGFPFETIYPATKRDSVMNKVMDFFFNSSAVGFARNLDNDVMLVFPNPAMNNLFVHSKANVNSEIELCDVAGRLVYKTKVLEKETMINTEQFNSGIYFVKLINIYGVKTCKVLIQH